MSKTNIIEMPQIVRSAQMWVCDTCGSQDQKSCGCNSTAHMEALAAKREAERQRGRGRREKAKENQHSHPADVDIENAREIQRSAAKLSTARMQTLMFESACRLLAEMSPATRAK